LGVLAEARLTRIGPSKEGSGMNCFNAGGSAGKKQEYDQLLSCYAQGDLSDSYPDQEVLDATDQWRLIRFAD
jgi:hypothetical protein